MPSKGPEQDNHQATSWRAKMVEKSLKKSTFSSADNLRFNECTNMDMIDDTLV
jgi:hypothetical protein